MLQARYYDTVGLDQAFRSSTYSTFQRSLCTRELESCANPQLSSPQKSSNLHSRDYCITDYRGFKWLHAEAAGRFDSPYQSRGTRIQLVAQAT